MLVPYIKHLSSLWMQKAYGLRIWQLFSIEVQIPVIESYPGYPMHSVLESHAFVNCSIVVPIEFVSPLIYYSLTLIL